jgi:6,7-dimethyl-8-ribityllumazine synthase
VPITLNEDLDGRGLRIAIAVSRFRSVITERMLAGAIEALQEFGVDDESVTVAWVPGSFELPFAARRFAESGKFDAVLCIGCVIKGETDHNEYINNQAARGIAEISEQLGVPAIFGVITPNNFEQAIARAGEGTTNKGYEAAVTGIVMANLKRRLAEL